MLCPNILTPPADAGSSPARQYSSVDFPEPDGPTIATISPGFTSSAIRCAARPRAAAPSPSRTSSQDSRTRPAAMHRMHWEQEGSYSNLSPSLPAPAESPHDSPDSPRFQLRKPLPPQAIQPAHPACTPNPFCFSDCTQVTAVEMGLHRGVQCTEGQGGDPGVKM